MTDDAALNMLLHDRRNGKLARLDGDFSIFTINEAYVADEDRATLSLTYRNAYSGGSARYHSILKASLPLPAKAGLTLGHHCQSAPRL
jgi:hypothetical protein